MKRFLAGLATSALATTALVGFPTPASADSYRDCIYPRVCFYRTVADWFADRHSAAYKDVTSYFQTLSASARGADMVLNTRNDDRAFLWVENHNTGTSHIVCLPPNDTIGFGSWQEVTKIQIDWEASCDA